ncbi:MAG: ABC transporter ATP-binding protein [Candidatus Staskawiczbacteria bacterium]|nr:ABC transporter ATP-binding protein [Candidatus Staskawiczbacteria bacterium]
MPIIQVENLSKKYRISHQENKAAYGTLTDEITNVFKKPIKWLKGHREKKEDIWAIKDISFSVEPGEILGIIGANGAGKSTLLKILTRITPPTNGRAIIKGRVSSLLEVGVGFHPELTGRDNIYLNGAILGMQRAEINKRFDEIVEFAGIDRFLDTPVKRYSSGMYVRLAFSVAAHLEPEILLVDEVLAVGDAAFQKKCLGKMKDVSSGGRTVLFVSHNMGTIQQLTKRCLLLEGGKLIMDGKTSDVIEKYLTSTSVSSESSLFESKTEVEGLHVDSITLDKNNWENGFNKPIKFDVRLNVKNAIKDLLILLQITNSVGIRTVAAKVTIPELPVGESMVSMVVNNHYLPPDIYNVNAELFFMGNCIFSQGAIIPFEISDINIDDWFMVRYTYNFGTYPPVTYTIKSVE